MNEEERCFEEYLRDKTEEQIRAEIRNLRKEMTRLKNVLENPCLKPPVKRRETMPRIRRIRQSIEIAKKTLIKAGGEYIPSREEIIAEDFEENIPYISRFYFSIGGCFSIHDSFAFNISESGLAWDQENTLNVPWKFDNPHDGKMGKDKFLAKIRKLYMGEWLRNYDTTRFGYIVLDGTQWEIKIEYSNGHEPVEFYGSNSYPYNFDSLARLFDVRWSRYF